MVGLIYAAWWVSAAAAIAAMAVSLARHGLDQFWSAMPCLFGAMLLAGPVVAAIGLTERFWFWHGPQLWFGLAAGVAGLWLQSVGWRAVLRPRARPGTCAGCGYPTTGLARCPECGQEVM